MIRGEYTGRSELTSCLCNPVPISTLVSTSKTAGWLCADATRTRVIAANEVDCHQVDVILLSTLEDVDHSLADPGGIDVELGRGVRPVAQSGAPVRSPILPGSISIANSLSSPFMSVRHEVSVAE